MNQFANLAAAHAIEDLCDQIVRECELRAARRIEYRASARYLDDLIAKAGRRLVCA